MPSRTCREARKLESDARAKARAEKREEARKAHLDAKGQPVVERPRADGAVVRLGLIAVFLCVSGCPKAEEMQEIKGDEKADTGAETAPAKAEEAKKADAKSEKAPSKPEKPAKAPAEGTKK